MQELLVEENVKIENMIYEIRGKQVMLDSDLAKLYQCKNGTKTINQAVNNVKDGYKTAFGVHCAKHCQCHHSNCKIYRHC